MPRGRSKQGYGNRTDLAAKVGGEMTYGEKQKLMDGQKDVPMGTPATPTPEATPTTQAPSVTPVPLTAILTVNPAPTPVVAEVVKLVVAVYPVPPDTIGLNVETEPPTLNE
jgi:hypothetical protein